MRQLGKVPGRIKLYQSSGSAQTAKCMCQLWQSSIPIQTLPKLRQRANCEVHVLALAKFDAELNFAKAQAARKP